MGLAKIAARVTGSLRDVHDRHRERHRPTGCGFAIADRLGLLDPAAWDAVTGQGSVLMRRPYLTALDHAAPPEVRHRFVLITRDERPIAAVVCQLLTCEGRRLHAADAGTGLLRQAGGKALDRLRSRVLVCGNLWTWGSHGVAWAPGVDPAEAWPAVGEALYRVRSAEGLAGQPGLVLVKDLPAGEDPVGLRRLSYRPVATEPDMVLTCRPEWRTLDGYLASLSAKYRKAAKDAIGGVTAAGLTVEHLTDLAPHAQAIHELYLQVHRRAAVRPLTTTAAYLPAIARALGPTGFRCTVIRRDRELLGFVTTIRDGDLAIAYQVGFDEAANRDAPLYFRLLYAAIADALELGCARISFGRTALEVKARLGAQAQPLAMWTRHRRQALNVLLRPLLGLVPHAEAPERSPFKGG